ncbi:hypothetical protein ACFYNO_32755 [Kitasatospora sp. NPDC006697]|uniref:hypothetical protein n=1 Tax=Kitasatospora sp. NPDC006697 TaxID=3364020 RepID=UPI00368CE7B1
MPRRYYGADHDDPDLGPRIGHVYRELCGGPLDGLLDVTSTARRRPAAATPAGGRPSGPGPRVLPGQLEAPQSALEGPW